MVSSELPEILGLCNRIIVMREGAISGVLEGEGATEETIMAHAVWQ
jgi:ribose transport system ATP-binding protein